MNCFLSGAIVRTGGSQPCIGGAPSAKYSITINNKNIVLKKDSFIALSKLYIISPAVADKIVNVCPSLPS